MRVYEERRDYIPMGRFRAWIYTIARNLCCDRFREPRPVRFDLDMPLILWSGVDPTSAYASWQETAADERLAKIGQAAEQLPPLMREAVTLKYYHALKLKEIAQVQDCPVGTVKSRLHYALKRMARMVAH